VLLAGEGIRQAPRRNHARANAMLKYIHTNLVTVLCTAIFSASQPTDEAAALVYCFTCLSPHVAHGVMNAVAVRALIAMRQAAVVSRSGLTRRLSQGTAPAAAAAVATVRTLAANNTARPLWLQMVG